MAEEGQSDRSLQIAVAVIGAVGLIVAGVVAAIATDILGGDGGDAVVVREAEDQPREPREPQGRITSPRGGEEVSPAFTAVGTLSGIPRGDHVWLATQVDNLLFPKEPEVPAQDQRWIQEVVEGGSPPGGAFSLVLLMVDAAGHEQIEEWLKRGERGEGFPGLTEIRGSVRLAVARDLVLR